MCPVLNRAYRLLQFSLRKVPFDHGVELHDNAADPYDPWSDDVETHHLSLFMYMFEKSGRDVNARL